MNRIPGIVLLVCGLAALDQAAPAQSENQTLPFDRRSVSPSSRTSIGSSSIGSNSIASNNDQSIPNDTSPSRVFMAQPASNEANCRRAKGSFFEVFNPQTNAGAGTISNAGWLNGATEGVVDTAGFATPDPRKFSFGSSMAVATSKGVIRGRRVFLFDVATGFGTDMTDIDPTTSTGVFVGATGVLYVHVIKAVTVEVGPYYQEITAYVCFQPGRETPER